MRALGLKITGGSHAHIGRQLKRLGVDTSHFRRTTTGRQSKARLLPATVFVRDRLNGRREKRDILRRVLLETGVREVCAACGQEPRWHGKPLTLHVDHEDGDFTNNEASNLRFLCIHCHSQTATFGSKNMRLPRTRTCETCSCLLRSNRRKYCSVRCSNNSAVKKAPRQKKATWPSDEELAKRLQSESALRVSKELGISSTALAKHCRRRGIPTMPRGHWAKVGAGRGT